MTALQMNALIIWNMTRNTWNTRILTKAACGCSPIYQYLCGARLIFSKIESGSSTFHFIEIILKPPRKNKFLSCTAKSTFSITSTFPDREQKNHKGTSKITSKWEQKMKLLKRVTSCLNKMFDSYFVKRVKIGAQSATFSLIFTRLVHQKCQAMTSECYVIQNRQGVEVARFLILKSQCESRIENLKVIIFRQKSHALSSHGNGYMGLHIHVALKFVPNLWYPSSYFKMRAFKELFLFLYLFHGLLFYSDILPLFDIKLLRKPIFARNRLSP